MPELPEVETVMLGMRKHLLDHIITDIDVRRSDLRRIVPPNLAQEGISKRIIEFRRRGKYICMRLSSGKSIIFHLGMSGKIILGDCNIRHSPRRHEHVVFITDRGATVSFVDSRRFGMIDIMADDHEDSHPLLRRLGIEPLNNNLTAQVLGYMLQRCKQPIKLALLDQGKIAGLGNIYASEILFRAHLSPFRRSRSLNTNELQLLILSTRTVLLEAIAAGGSSLRDYVRTSGEIGYFQHAWRVYNREGAVCLYCKKQYPSCESSIIIRSIQSGRSTYFCPTCQV